MGVEGVIRRPKVNLKLGKGRSGGDQSTQRSTARSEEDVDSSDEPESNDDGAEDDDDEKEDNDEGNSGRQVPPQHSKSKDRDSTRIGTFLLCPTTITQVLLKSPKAEESSSIPGNENELEEGPVWWEDELLSLSFNLSSFKFSESKDRFEDQEDWEDAKLREAINWYIEPWGLTYDSKEDIQTPQAKVFLENLKNVFGEGKGGGGCGYPKVRVSLEEPVGEIGGYVKVKTGEYPGLLDGYRWLSDVRGWPMEKGAQQKEKFIELMETVAEVTCDA